MTGQSQSSLERGGVFWGSHSTGTVLFTRILHNVRRRLSSDAHTCALRRCLCSTCVGEIAAFALRTALIHGRHRLCPGCFPPSFPFILRHEVGQLHACYPRPLNHPLSLQPLVVPYLHLRRFTHSSYSQDVCVAHQLCGGEERRPQPRDHVGGVFPGRDQDCVRIVRQDGQSLGFRCAVSSNSTLLVQN